MKRALVVVAAIAAVSLFSQCRSTSVDAATQERSDAAFATVYEVLQHPRCKNCHPAGDAPLQGEQSRVHGQHVQRGPDGKGLFAMRCVNCHRDENTPGLNLPPGAPNWHLPSASMPLVFEGRSPAQLARQLADRRHNGGKDAAQLLEHVRHDPLVLWGWAPGEGRQPVSVPHERFVDAMRTWIELGQLPPRDAR